MHSQESVWLPVSGMEDNTVKFMVGAFTLKKITKDLPSHPIPLAFNKDHLSDLKLADLNFKTPACQPQMILVSNECCLARSRVAMR